MASVMAVLTTLVMAAVLTPSPALAQAQPPDPRRSGLDFMSPALQALQTDDSQNPAMLWVQDGAALCEFFAWLEVRLADKRRGPPTELDIDTQICAARARL